MSSDRPHLARLRSSGRLLTSSGHRSVIDRSSFGHRPVIVRPSFGHRSAIDLLIAHWLFPLVLKATRSYLPDQEPKEKHVLALKRALESGSHRSYVAISLLHRLHGARDWVTAVKTSVVIHRLLKETQPPTTFLDELCRAQGAESAGNMNISVSSNKKRVYPLHMDGFLDTKAVDGRYDFSEWVRAHCKYLDESLDAYFHTGWYADLETSDKESVLRGMSIADLLETLPRVQKVQRRLIDCRPTGAACQNDNTLLALSLVVRESFKIYKAINEGIINLVDKFFQMDYYQGVRGMETYKEACQGCDDLQKYLGQLGQLDAVKRVIEFPKIQMPPRDFLDVMKDRLQELKCSQQTETTRKEPLRLRRGLPAEELASIPFSMGTSSSVPTKQSDRVSTAPVDAVDEKQGHAPTGVYQDELLDLAETDDHGKGDDAALEASVEHRDNTFELLSELESLDFSFGLAVDHEQKRNNPFY